MIELYRIYMLTVSTLSILFLSAAFQSSALKNHRGFSKSPGTFIQQWIFPTAPLSRRLPLQATPAAANNAPNYRPIPVMPSQLFQQLALSQLELLASSLTLDTQSEDKNEGLAAGKKDSKIKSMALYLPQENPATGALEFSPAVRYPHPSSERVFIANEAESGVAPKLPRTLTTLPGFAHATSLIPGYPLLSTSTSTEVGVGVVEEVLCDIRSSGGGAALSVPLVAGSRTVGVLLVSPNVQMSVNTSQGTTTGSVWSNQDREQVAQAAKSLSLALSMDAERAAVQEQNRQAQEALSDSLHQVKNPLQSLRTFGKLLQQRIADMEEEVATPNRGMTPQLFELAEHLMVQSDRLEERLKPVDGIVESLAASRDRNPLALLSAPEVGALVPFQIPLVVTQESNATKAEQGTTLEFGSQKRGRVTPSVKTSPPSKVTTVNYTRGERRRSAPPPKEYPSSFSLLNSGKLNLEISFIDDVLETILPGFKAIASDTGIAFDIFLSEELPGVKICPEALQEAVTNVLDNAFRYVRLLPHRLSAAPSVRLRILPNEKPLAAGVTIIVEDNGPGIPVQERETVFQRGLRGTNVVHRVPGSGIGLDIARSLVEAMGGQLQVVDNDKHGGALDGTVMEFTLYRNPDRKS